MKGKDGEWFRKESQHISKQIHEYLTAMEKHGVFQLGPETEAQFFVLCSMLKAHGLAELFGPPDMSPNPDPSTEPW